MLKNIIPLAENKLNKGDERKFSQCLIRTEILYLLIYQAFRHSQMLNSMTQKDLFYNQL
jgi:hypothetical protein